MDNKFRTQTYDGTDRAGNSTEVSAGPDAEDTITIGELARQSGITLRALRFYQSKGLLAPQRSGSVRVFSPEDRDRLTLIMQGKRLGFTLTEIREMLAARARGGTTAFPISREKCVEQINMLKRQRRDIDMALTELRRIYTEMFTASEISRRVASRRA
jgi:DNA-binding transcriptional MerR regulator